MLKRRLRFRARLRRAFPSIPGIARLEPHEAVALPLVIAFNVLIWSHGLVVLGDRLGLAYGERTNPPMYDCEIHPDC